MDGLPSLDDVYRRFGEVSEAAQLLETELGTLLLWEQCVEEDLLGQDGKRATEIMRGMSRQTLGSLIRNAKGPSHSVEGIADLLERALGERNRLSHSFYRRHNFRRNPGEGWAVMMQDLEAYKALLLLGGTDLNEVAKRGPFELPTAHVKI